MTTPQLHIAGFALGQWQTNCYVVHAAGGAAWFVDAGFQPGPMLDYAREHDLHPEKLVLTHAHVDHIGGVAAVRDAYPGLPIAIHRDEAGFLSDTGLNLSAYLAEPVVAPDADEMLDHGQRLTLSGVAFEVRHTPGHSPGGITLYQREHAVALVGDALFAGSIGRHDFPTSDGPLLIRSIHAQLLTLPDETRVLPGHGPETTIGAERVGNPFLR